MKHLRGIYSEADKNDEEEKILWEQNFRLIQTEHSVDIEDMSTDTSGFQCVRCSCDTDLLDSESSSIEWTLQLLARVSSSFAFTFDKKTTVTSACNCRHATPQHVIKGRTTAE